MAIIVNEKRFTIHTNGSTYQMKVDEYGYLLHLYYGRRAEGEMEQLFTFADRGFSGNPYDAGADRMYSMDALPQEFPCQGTGDYRSTAFVVENADGAYSCDLRYESYEIQKGKYQIPGLPAVYAKEDEAESLLITLCDQVSGLRVVLCYGVLPALDIITRSVIVKNAGEKTVNLKKVESACLDFVGGEFDAITFYGRHAMERNYQRTRVAHGNHVIGSRRGTSSHQYSPMMILADKNATEEAGSCYAMSFVYSGGFKGEVEKDQFNQTRMLLGLQDEMFSYPLAKDETFYAPEVILTYSKDGLQKLSHNLHKCIREHICRGKYRDVIRPVLVNSWEASYFDFTGENIVGLAKEAAALGIEMVVMDDGWFGKRDDDNSGLGDWTVNEKKLGCTLGELIKEVNKLGVKFGIWVEPEMVNEDSDLYRKHPDWAFAVPGKKPVRSRNQLVLDFSRKEVVDAVFEQICGVLDQGNIEYLKWDMNRSICDVYSCVTENQGKVLYDYILGLYDFLERLTIHYPNLLIEGCSGGGGRFDAGMLYYTPQIWCSDNTDAFDRTQIQYGTSFGFPVSTMGAHVSAVPNHQTGRVTTLKARGVTAMAGTFGYELNLSLLTEEEKEEIKEQVKTFHKYASLIWHGDYYRLSNPFEEEAAAWANVAADQSEVLLSVVMLKMHGNMTANYIRMRGLCEHAFYKEKKSQKIYSAEALMEVGFPVLAGIGDQGAYQWHFIRV